MESIQFQGHNASNLDKYSRKVEGKKLTFCSLTTISRGFKERLFWSLLQVVKTCFVESSSRLYPQLCRRAHTVKTWSYCLHGLPPIILQVVIYPDTAGYVSKNNAVCNWKEKKNENNFLGLGNKEVSPLVYKNGLFVRISLKLREKNYEVVTLKYEARDDWHSKGIFSLFWDCTDCACRPFLLFWVESIYFPTLIYFLTVIIISHSQVTARINGLTTIQITSRTASIIFMGSSNSASGFSDSGSCSKVLSRTRIRPQFGF